MPSASSPQAQVPAETDIEHPFASWDGPSAPKASAPSDVLPHISLQWASLDEAKLWMQQEQSEKLFSFASKDRIKRSGRDVDWTETLVYVCSRGSSGGKKKYTKKGHWKRVHNTKCTGCKARLRLTLYSDKVVGRYTPEHNHPLGHANARFTSISPETRKSIEEMLKSGVSPENVLRSVHRNKYDERNLNNLRTSQASRDDFITRADIRRIEKGLEQVSIRLANDDGASVLKWVETLRNEGHFVFLKTSSEAPPEGSNLASDAFV
ncbi:hypothetical protein NMY22_g2517 [Coprinellus aureogranulatus]|nr:hypothetical protein NMY22_g2517 [Coprinellus aureogranulatus]